MRIFTETIGKIRSHNEGNASYKLGTNQFADVTFNEFVKMNQINESTQRIDIEAKSVTFDFSHIEDLNVPSSFDWRSRGAVTKVQNQESCGCCYAFAALGAIESIFFLKHGNLIDLSVQEIVDCASEKYHTWGCDGGFVFHVFDYVKDNREVSLASDYPYESTRRHCRLGDTSKVQVDLVGFVETPWGDEELLKKIIAHIGPVTVSLDINHESFMRYSTGIYNEPDCTHLTNHALLLIGYGSEGDQDFWIVKNSFGEAWGERGFMRLLRHFHNHCGIGIESYFPILN